MYRTYDLVSPSLKGILSHDQLSYEGIKKPSNILRVLDGPFTEKKRQMLEQGKEDKRVLEEYMHDLFVVFTKKLSSFVADMNSTKDESVKLLAMLQEIVKVKDMIGLFVKS